MKLFFLIAVPILLFLTHNNSAMLTIEFDNLQTSHIGKNVYIAYWPENQEGFPNAKNVEIGDIISITSTKMSVNKELSSGPGLPSFDPASFSSLSQVKALFQDDAMLTAGWIHYLAFDLFIGSIIVQKGLALKIPRWQYTVCLPFTFMFGPIGLLLFYLFKALKK